MWRDAFTGAIALNLGVWDDIADVITHANRFRVFGVLIPPILPFTVGV